MFEGKQGGDSEMLSSRRHCHTVYQGKISYVKWFEYDTVKESVLI